MCAMYHGSNITKSVKRTSKSVKLNIGQFHTSRTQVLTRMWKWTGMQMLTHIHTVPCKGCNISSPWISQGGLESTQLSAKFKEIFCSINILLRIGLNVSYFMNKFDNINILCRIRTKARILIQFLS